MKPDYSFQSALIEQAWGHMTGPKKAVVLAAGCGAGKTEMAVELIVKFLEDNPTKRVLILAHGTTSLRAQISKRLSKDRRFTSSEIKDAKSNLEATVHIAIPHNKTIREQKYGLVVVDEAHHYYFGKMVQNILLYNLNCVQLLLTASHWRFTRTQLFPVLTYSQCELLDNNIIMDPHVGMMYTDQEFRTFNAQGDLKETETLKNVAELLTKIKSKLKGKTLIACHNQQAARDISKGIKGSVVSTSDDDPDERAFNKFLTDSKCKVMIVVFRGVVGFNLPQLETVIDLTCSQNPDRIYQLLGRCVRRHQAKTPRYVKLAPKTMREWYQHIMCGVMFLADPKIYEKWDGTLDSIKMVVQKSATKGTKANGKRTLPTFKPKIPRWVEIPMLLERLKDDKDYEFTSLSRIKGMRDGVDPAGKKQWLMGTALAGGSRPRQKTEIGRVLSSYTHPKSNAYDESWTKVLYSVRPDWRFSSICEEKKRQLIELKSAGVSRPLRNHRLGQALTSYVANSAGSYDPDFVTALVSTNPDNDWYIGKEKNASRKRRVRCIETRKIFESIIEASAFAGRHKSSVGASIKAGGTAGGYHWEYVE